MEKNSGYGKTAFMLVKPFGLWNVSDDMESVGGRLDMVEKKIVASRDNIKRLSVDTEPAQGSALGLNGAIPKQDMVAKVFVSDWDG